MCVSFAENIVGNISVELIWNLASCSGGDKDIFILALADILFRRAEQLCNLGGGYYEEHFYELILNFWLRKRCLLKFIYF